jgi:hypothetical protein
MRSKVVSIVDQVLAVPGHHHEAQRGKTYSFDINSNWLTPICVAPTALAFVVAAYPALPHRATLCRHYAADLWTIFAFRISL